MCNDVIVNDNGACFAPKFYGGAYFGILLSLFWAASVMANVVHCSTAGTYVRRVSKTLSYFLLLHKFACYCILFVSSFYHLFPSLSLLLFPLIFLLLLHEYLFHFLICTLHHCFVTHLYFSSMSYFCSMFLTFVSSITLSSFVYMFYYPRPITHSLTHSFTHSHTHTHTHTHSLTHTLTYPHTHLPIHSLTHSPTHSVTHSLTHTHTLTHTLTHSLSYPLTHSLTHTHTLTHTDHTRCRGWMVGINRLRTDLTRM